MGKVGEDLGTNPIQPLDDLSLEGTAGSGQAQARPEAPGFQLRGQLGPGVRPTPQGHGHPVSMEVGSEAGAGPSQNSEDAERGGLGVWAALRWRLEASDCAGARQQTPLGL